MNTEIREFQVFVKPVGGTCNLDCSYCYYLDKELFYPGNSNKVMTEELLERYIIGHLEASSEEVVMFSWHGGEPTLAGVDFFRKAVEIQKRHQPVGLKIVNGIQTNGTLLNEEWCGFMASEGFVAGISMDGPPHIHNQFRVSKDRRASFSQVLRGYEMLQKYRIQTEILCVVNAFNVNFPLEVYRFFKELGVRYLTFLPLVERVIESSPAVSGRTVPSVAFGEFLCTVFDEWLEEDIGTIKIQIIEEAARIAFKQEHTLCIFKKRCGGVPVIEKNGDFYSCDHFVDPAYKIGNISSESLLSLLDHSVQRVFGEAKETTLPQYCRECLVLDMCNGECPKNRFINTPTGEPGLNYLCEGYKIFFNHCSPFVDAVAASYDKG